MIECQVDVIERVTNLMCDCRGEPSDHCAFLGLMKLSLELAGAREFRSHLVECGSECAHLVESIGGHLNIEVAAGDFSRRCRKLLNGPSKTPDKEPGDQRRHKQ